MMMNEAGFIINQSMQECKRQTEELKKEKECLKLYKDAVNTQKSDNDKLMKEIEAAKKDFTKVLQEELLNQTESSNETEQ